MASVPVHEEILAAVRRICGERGEWTFDTREIVAALPHLNANTVRTHVTSRCCVNAPKNHPHKWNYFRRIGRGRYELLPLLRQYQRRARRSVVRDRTPLRDTVHAIVSRSGDHYVVECLEVAVVTQGHTLDEALSNLRDAVTLHLEGEEPAALGLADHPRLSVTYETALV